VACGSYCAHAFVWPEEILPSSQSPIDVLEEAIYQARNSEAPLNDRLLLVADQVRALSPKFAAGVDRLVERLRSGGAGEGAPKVGEEMPAFVLPDQDGRLVDLNDILAEGPVVVTFHRGFWCPYCRLSTAALVDANASARAFGGQFVSITPDRRRYSNVMRSEFGAEFPFLTDVDNAYAVSLNLVIWVGAEMQAMLAERGRDLPQYQGNDAWMVPIPATFVVGTDGIIRARHVDPDYRQRMEVEELLNALRSAR
jgi:peroxiredoxin